MEFMDNGWLRKFVLARDFWLLTGALLLLLPLCGAGLERHRSFAVWAPANAALDVGSLEAPAAYKGSAPAAHNGSAPTLVIVAGMPYSGLSFVQSALAEQCRASPGCAVVCPPRLPDFFEELQPGALQQATAELRSGLKALAKRKGRLFVMDCGDWSYPRLPWKWTDMLAQPDLHRLQKLARRAGLDLHAVVPEQDVAEATRRYLAVAPKGERSLEVAQAYGMRNLSAGLPLFFQRRLYLAAISLHMQLELMGEGTASCLCLYCAEARLGTERLERLLPGAEGRLKALKAARALEALDYEVPKVNVWYSGMMEAHVARFRRRCYGEGQARVVAKSSLGGEQRLLSVVGLEGTGHHFWEVQLEPMPLAPDELLQWSKPNHVFRQSYGEQGRGSATEMNPHVLKSSAATLPQSLQQRFREKPGACLKAKVKQQSFPTFKGVFKALHLVDITRDAAALDAAGVDVRFLVSLRSLENILHSTKRRNFNNAGGLERPDGYEPRVLEVAAAFLLASLKMLDPSFLICTDYDNLRTSDVRRLETFTKSRLPSNIMKSYRSHWHKPEPLTGAQQAFSLTLGALLKEMVALCNISKG